MCDYCEHEKPIVKDWYGWDLFIRRDRRGNPKLTIECVSGITCIDIGISNCPMCGRKLGGDAS